MNTPDVQLLKRAAIVSGLLLSLAACGGSSSAPDAVPPPVAATEVPASATASVAAYSAYAGSMSPNESADPLSVAKVMAPTSETDEPVDVN